MGPDEMIAISRTIAMPGDSLQCVVYENTDLVVHVANSRVTGPGKAVDACTEPYEAFDLDYYLPTITAKPDKAFYATGDTIQVALTVSNTGRPRKLEARAVGWPQRGTGSLALVVPAGAAKGPFELVVELLEAGTDDVVDYAR